MSVKIRLQRRGRTHYAQYAIVVADTRAPRDGKYIEKLGTYNPNTNPAAISVNAERAIHWLQIGAQPSDTCRSLLKYKGVIYKNHLLNGVAKGALTQEQADEKYEEWKQQKETKIDNKKTKLSEASQKEEDKKLEAEKKIHEARMEDKAKQQAKLLEAEKKENEEENEDENEDETKEENTEEKS